MKPVLLNTTDLIVTPTAELRPLVMNDDGWLMVDISIKLVPTHSEPGLHQSFTHQQIRDFLKSEDYARVVHYFDPGKALLRLGRTNPDFSAAEEKEVQRALWKEDYCETIIKFRAQKKIVLTEDSIEDNLRDIENDVNARINRRKGKALPRSGKARKSRAGTKRQTLTAPCAKTLLNWHRRYVKASCNPLVLRDHYERCGNWTMRLDAEVAAPMAIEVAKFAHDSQPTPTAIWKAIERVIDSLNKDRENQLAVPSIRAVVRAIERLDKYTTMSRRHGPEFVLKWLAARTTDFRNDHLGHEVQIDEWRIDLFELAVASNIWPYLTIEERKQVKRLRRWLTMALETASRMVLGLIITPTPSVEGGLAVLEQVCSDKTELARAVNAAMPWHHAVVPASISTDWGAAYVTDRFRQAVADLGATKSYPEAGKPMGRAFLERAIGTAAILVPELFKDGKSFSDIIRKGTYPAQDRAGATDDEVAWGIVRIILDVYHANAHDGLMGATPLDEWERLSKHGTPPPLDRRMQRSLFGQIHQRVVTRHAIRFLGNYYSSPELKAFSLQSRSNIEPRRGRKQPSVEIRVDLKNLGAISARINGRLVHMKCEDSDMEGRSAALWISTVTAIKAENARKAQLRRSAVRDAYKAVEELVNGSQGRATIAPILPSPEDINRSEEAIFAQYEMAEDDDPVSGDIFANPIVPGNLARSVHHQLTASEARALTDAQKVPHSKAFEERASDIADGW